MNRITECKQYVKGILWDPQSRASWHPNVLEDWKTIPIRGHGDAITCVLRQWCPSTAGTPPTRLDCRVFASRACLWEHSQDGNDVEAMKGILDDVASVLLCAMETSPEGVSNENVDSCV